MTCSGLTLTNPEVNALNQMLVDCSRAGENVLFVAVLGTGGQEQVHVKHKEDNKFMVKFMMREHGNHILYVKWGEQNIPGSPFLIDV